MADPGLQIRGRGAVIQTLRKEAGGGGGGRPNKIFFQPFGPQFGLKTRGVGAGYVQFQKNNFTRSEISQKRIEARYKNEAEKRKC